MWPDESVDRLERGSRADIKIGDRPAAFEQWVRPQLWLSAHEKLDWGSAEVQRYFAMWQNQRAPVADSWAGTGIGTGPILTDRPEAFERWYRDKHWISAHIPFQWESDHVRGEFASWSELTFSVKRQDSWD
jgi:hypothetical protein